VPANIESVKVKYPGANGKELMLFYDRPDSGGAIYIQNELFTDPELIPTGEYTFTVTDFDTNSHIFRDTLLFNPLPLPINLSPANGVYVTGTTPKIDWDNVPGATAYRVKVYKGFDSNTDEIFDSLKEFGPLVQSECTVPPGKLAEGLTYSYRVYAYREDPTIDVDNASGSPFRSTERPQFTVIREPDIDGDGISNAIDTSPNSPAYDFSDGATTGRIVKIANNQHIKISDVSAPEGVLIAADTSNTGDPIEVSVCGGAAEFKLSAGDNLLVTCGSVTAKVLWGEVDTKFVSTSNVVATATLELGKGLSFDPITTTFAALKDNTAPVEVKINNEIIVVGQGSATKIGRFDIKPGSSDNTFNPNLYGVLPVAIYGSASLDVRNIDLSSLKLQGLNVKLTGKKSAHYLSHFQDIDEDGFLDLVVHFEDSTGWQTPGSDYAILTGNIVNGPSIEGFDLIVIVH
jgi:hypothetical protein